LRGVIGVGLGLGSASTRAQGPDPLRPLEPGTWRDLQHDRDPLVMTAVLPASPRQVFEALVAPEPWPQWLSLVERVQYRDGARGVGCERDVTVRGGGVIREHFIAWQPGERLTFFVREATSSLLAMFMEDYVVLPIEGGATRLRWTVAARLSPAALAPVFRRVFCQEAERGLVTLAALLRSRGQSGVRFRWHAP
jgi:hypothetical protein